MNRDEMIVKQLGKWQVAFDGIKVQGGPSLDGINRCMYRGADGRKADISKGAYLLPH